MPSRGCKSESSGLKDRGKDWQHEKDARHLKKKAEIAAAVARQDIGRRKSLREGVSTT